MYFFIGRKNRNVLYSHNDSGGNATVFILNPRGKSLGTKHFYSILFYIPLICFYGESNFWKTLIFSQFLGRIHLENVNPIDVEDIAIGPSSDDSSDYIYFGDIGNNRRTRTQIQIYKFLEPNIDSMR